MTWDVPTAEDCPKCGFTMFKKSGRGRMKPFCINETCENFLPEDKRGYYKKKETAGEAPEAQQEEAKPAAKKTSAKKSTAKKTAEKKTSAKKTAEKKSSARKTDTKKTTTRKNKGEQE